MLRPVAVVLALASASCAGREDTPAPAPPAASPAASIEWHDWSPEPFAAAARDDKIVVIDVGMEGCTACRWMDEITYTDPAVIERIRERFIAVQVDSEARPDIGERYSQWAWPATIFLAPDGSQVLAIRGNKLPKNFVPILDRLIDAQDAGTLQTQIEQTLAPPSAQTGPLVELRSAVIAQMDRAWNDEHDGWGRRLMMPLWPLPRHALLRAHARGQVKWRERGLESLEHWPDLIDPVWGGIFVAAKGPGWGDFIPEKRLAYQAGALEAFAAAYQHTGDEQWLAHAGDIDRYLSEMTMSPTGTFFASQEDDAPGLPRELSAFDYYAELDDPGRRQFGIPPIDHAVYTDLNALAIVGYVRLHQATGDETWRERAQRAALSLVQTHRTSGGWFRQVVRSPLMDEDDRMRHLPDGERMYLRPQAAMGLALLAMHEATADDRYRQWAIGLADAMLTGLEDPQGGGLLASDDASTDAIAPRRKPVVDNARAAEFLYRLGTLTKSDRYRAAAKQTVRAVATPSALAEEGMLVGELALTLELVTTGAVEMSLVGSPDDPVAEALYAAAGRLYEPRRVLHYEAPGRYPARERASLYICNDEACSAPIDDVAGVETAAAKFAARPR